MFYFILMNTLDYWKFIAGLGLFLFGMMRLEESLKNIAGKKFKVFLKKYTTNRVLAILNGAFATAILQSSSIVLLFVIAFAGAGIISLSNSLGIILGANLGTTITGWFVSVFGFNTKLESFIFPMIGIGSLGVIFINRRLFITHFFELIISVGLLLMGLGFMKESMGQLAGIIDVRELQRFGLMAYFLFGFVITAIIQSSSAMMTITLSALFAQVITLEMAIYIVIGADLGTTITALMASFRGTAVKKRVGLAHFFFNVSTAVMGILAISPILHVIKVYLNISDPLYILVAFHSGFNFLGIVLFFPFLGYFEIFLNRFFQNTQSFASKFIHKVSTEVPEASLEAIRLELNHFARKIYKFNSRIFNFPEERSAPPHHESLYFLKALLVDENTIPDYEKIKRIEGELLEYFVSVQKEKLEQVESEKLNQYILALRNGVQAAKSAKDIQHNLKEFHQSVAKIVELFTAEIVNAYQPVQKLLSHAWEGSEEKSLFQNFSTLYSSNEVAFQNLNKWIYQSTMNSMDDEVEIATFLNVNREIYNANRLLIDAMKEILMPIQAAQNLSSLSDTFSSMR